MPDQTMLSLFSAINSRAFEKYQFYDGDFSYADLETSKIASTLPLSKVGWGKRAVEMRANKTHFDRFENDTIGLNAVWDKFHGAEALAKIKNDVLIAGCGFLALAIDDDGEGRIMPFTALEATGKYDWFTQNLKKGTAVFRENTDMINYTTNTPDAYMQFFGDQTLTYDDGEITPSPNVTGRPLMTLLTHKSTTKQPFGHSVLSATARNAIVDASRTVRQAVIAGYHYNTKVDTILGVDVETSVEKKEMKTGDVLLVGPNENGQIPQLGEFAQHAMAPFNDSIEIFAKNFCSDTKLSLTNLGIASNAPQSPEALEIVGDDLREDINEWQNEMGQQIKYFATTLYMYENNISEIDDNLRAKIDAINVAWLPIYTADVSKFGDGLGKMAAFAPAITKQRSLWKNLGLTSAEIDEVVASANDKSDI